MRTICLLTAVCVAAGSAASADDKELNVPPKGFKALFNGKDLTNWKKDHDAETHWAVIDGVLHYDGKGASLVTEKDYGDFILHVDWKIGPKGDSGIYLRGKPQVQIWDTEEPSYAALGATKGSGGLWNNAKHEKHPLAKADNPVGQWNTFVIKIVDDKVTVHLNDKLVVDNTVLEDYQNRDRKIPAAGSIELQHHGNPLEFRNIYIKELKKK